MFGIGLVKCSYVSLVPSRVRGTDGRVAGGIEREGDEAIGAEPQGNPTTFAQLEKQSRCAPGDHLLAGACAEYPTEGTPIKLNINYKRRPQPQTSPNRTCERRGNEEMWGWGFHPVPACLPAMAIDFKRCISDLLCFVLPFVAKRSYRPGYTCRCHRKISCNRKIITIYIV